MRYTPSEKLEIIRLVDESDLPVKRTLGHLGVGRSTFYEWYQRYLEEGPDGLAARPSQRRRFWNRIPDRERERVVAIALEKAGLVTRANLLSWDPDNPCLPSIRSLVLLGVRAGEKVRARSV